MHELPYAFQQTISRIFGDAGQYWLDRFTDTLLQCRERWNLVLGEPFPDLSVNYVTNASLPTGERVVLKIGVLPHEVRYEIEALQLYQERRMVRCVDADLHLNAMLLACMAPGTKLNELGNNAQEAVIAADMMRTLPIPCPTGHHLPTFAEWIERAFTRVKKTYGPGGGPLGSRLLDMAEQSFQGIQQSKQRDVLLHGDLHHTNILFDDRYGWTAIDPKGVIGDACLEVGRYLQNQLPQDLSLAERIIEERVEILSAELNESPERIRCCALVDKVLSLCWCLEDSFVDEGWECELAIAQLLSGKV
jgi:streptomycin 6-kinase